LTIKDSSNEATYEDFAATALVKAKTKSKVRSGCLGIEPGKINTDPLAHVIGCWIRKRLISRKFTLDTSAVPNKRNDRFRLGVASNI
jgi:hypothetical protein